MEGPTIHIPTTGLQRLPLNVLLGLAEDDETSIELLLAVSTESLRRCIGENVD